MKKVIKFDLFIMEQALPRESSIKQMKRLRKSAGKDIGDKTKGRHRKSSNLLKTSSPLDGKVDTYEKFVKKDNKKGLGYKKIK